MLFHLQAHKRNVFYGRELEQKNIFRHLNDQMDHLNFRSVIKGIVISDDLSHQKFVRFYGANVNKYLPCMNR